jgi:hypothetical protein
MREGNVVKRLLLCAAFCSPAFCAIDGVVMNITKGVVQEGVSINLVQPGQGGMQTLGTVSTDVAGKFHFDKDPPPGPALLQGNYKDVTYTLVVTPGSPTQGLQMSVYDTTNKAASNKLNQHMILLEPTGTELRVSETFLLDNDSNATFQDPAKGSVQIYVPSAEPKGLIASVEGTAGMAIRRPLQKTQQKGVYKLDYPIKPGGGRFDISYTIPSVEKFSGKRLRLDGPTRIVTARGVTLTGSAIKDLGQEPQSQAHIYDVLETNYEVAIKGTGTLRPDPGAANTSSASKEDNGAPQAAVVPARVYERLWWVLGLSFAILAMGGTLLYRRGTE